MKKRILLLVLLMVVFLLARLPASLADQALSAATRGELRLAEAQGTLWHGQARLASPDADEILRAWMALAWDFDAAALLHGELGVRLSEAGQPVARVALGTGGVTLHDLRLDLPLRALANAIPEAAARMGWRGDLRLESKSLVCGLGGRCNGKARVTWANAGVDVLPEQNFGTYMADIQARQGDLDFTLATLTGDIAISGKGRMPWGGALQLDALVSGDTKIVDALPNVLGDYASRTGRPGETRIRVR